MNPKYFCSSPFTRMTQSPNGDLRTCVYSPPLKNKYNTIEEAFLSDEMENIRQEMRDGKRRPECEWCYFYDESNQYSCRQDINERYPEPPSTELRELDFAYSNKCNYICVTCDEAASSGWQERNKEIRFNDSETVFALSRKIGNIKRLKQLTLMGGEPTIEPYYNDVFWDYIESISDKTLWYQMVTNCSKFPNKRWIDFLSNLDKVCIGISLDGVGEVGEFCRLGWKERIWRKNFLKWMDFFSDREYDTKSRHNGPWINIVVSNFNILNIKDTLNYVDKLGMRDRVMLTTAFEPTYLSPSYLPNNLKDKILNSEFYDENHKTFIQDIINKNEESYDVYKKFENYCKYLNMFIDLPKGVKWMV